MEFTKNEQKILNVQLALSLVRILFKRSLISKKEYETAIQEANRILEKQ